MTSKSQIYIQNDGKSDKESNFQIPPLINKIYKGW